jgi:hypothetical protein
MIQQYIDKYRTGKTIMGFEEINSLMDERMFVCKNVNETMNTNAFLYQWVIRMDLSTFDKICDEIAKTNIRVALKKICVSEIIQSNPIKSIDMKRLKISGKIG